MMTKLRIPRIVPLLLLLFFLSGEAVFAGFSEQEIQDLHQRAIEEGWTFEINPNLWDDTNAPVLLPLEDFNDLPIERTYSFGPPRITPCVFEHEGLSYDSVKIESLANRGAPGFPVLPFKTVKILIPAGEEVKQVRVRPKGRLFLGEGYCIEFGKRPVPISFDGLEQPGPNLDVYSSDTPYPPKVHSGETVQSFRGYQVLLLNLYPIQYIPSTGELYYFTDITVTVTFTDEIRRAKGKSAAPGRSKYRARRCDEEHIKRIVDNPEMTASYAPVGVQQPVRSKGGTAKALAEGSYDMVIITSEDFLDSSAHPDFEDLVNAKSNRGVDAAIVTVEDIVADEDYRCYGTYGDCPGDYDCADGQFDDTAARIRNCIKDAYENWGISYVLLAGDGDGDDVGGESGDDIIPARCFYTVISFPDEDCIEYVASDNYYCCLDGSWDDDEDGKWGEPGEDDMYAEVYIGRAPVDSVQEMQNFVRKTLAYENSKDDYVSKALMAAEGLGFYMKDGKRFKEQIRLGATDDGFTTVGFPDYFLVNTLYDKDGKWSKEDLISAMNEGHSLINHLGHANVTKVMRLSNEDVDGLANEEYFFAYSQGCMSGSFDNHKVSSGCSESYYYVADDCIAEHFVTSENGAFAVVMNSRLGWGTKWPDINGPSQRYDRRFFHGLFSEDAGGVNLGVLNQYSKESNIDFIVNGPECETDEWPCDDVMRWCYYEITLFGDPEISFHFVGVIVSEIQVHDGTEWVDCKGTTYGSELTKVRAKCVSLSDDPVTSVSFKLENITLDYEVFSGNGTYQGDGFWEFDNDDFQIADSGLYRLTVTGVNANSNEGVSCSDWFVWGFHVLDASEEPVARFDGGGNLFLQGTLEENSSQGATTKDEFRVRANGNDVAIIDSTDGNMYITGSLTSEWQEPSGRADDFIVMGNAGYPVAYIDESGNLFLKGQLHEYWTP